MSRDDRVCDIRRVLKQIKAEHGDLMVMLHIINGTPPADFPVDPNSVENFVFAVMPNGCLVIDNKFLALMQDGDPGMVNISKVLEVLDRPKSKKHGCKSSVVEQMQVITLNKWDEFKSLPVLSVSVEPLAEPAVIIKCDATVTTDLNNNVRMIEAVKDA